MISNCRSALILLLMFFLTACELFVSTPPPTPTATAVSTNTPAPVIIATETAVPPIPSPTPQPSTTPFTPLAAWTVLVYMDADNNLEQSGLLDFNEMELAGSSEDVNVLVQIDRAVGESDADGDWTETRRYRLVGDTDPQAINAELLENLGERNMGHPDALANFIQWGQTTYPAHKYALVIWDHGAGWNGVAFDGGSPQEPTADHLSLADLDEALGDGLQGDKLDLLGFDACLMGQLDVLEAIRPYAHIAVTSPELIPGQGWDYQTSLSHLYANPEMNGAQLGSQIVNDYINYYTQINPDDFVSLTAVDLAQFPMLHDSVNRLTNILINNPDESLEAIGDARSGAIRFAKVYAQDSDPFAAIDLGHFASVLAQRSLDEDVVAAAQELQTAVSQTVIANGTGAGLHNSQGIAIYFPRTRITYDSTYENATQFDLWNQFLDAYYRTGFNAEGSSPEINIYNVITDVVGVQNPAFLQFQIIGRNIETVSMFASRHEEDGRYRLVEYDWLIPEPTILEDGSEIYQWHDGIHDDFFIWDTEVTYLYDDQGNGDFVIMWPTEPDSGLFTVHGQLRRANETKSVAANLVFNHRTGELHRVWAVQSNESNAPAEIIPQPGDEFQITNYYQEENLPLAEEPGTSLLFNANGQIYFDWRPLPSGEYQWGVDAENISELSTVTTHPFYVQNDAIIAGYKAYLDPYLGFQFNYPADWYTPRYHESLLYTTNPTGTTQLLITTYPNLGADITAATLKTQTLNQFGDVTIVAESTRQIGDVAALQTTYSYTDGQGDLHSGIFYTFVNAAQAGFVVDLDGLALDEEVVLATAVSLADSWQFVDAGIGTRPGRWSTLDLAAFSVAQPADFTHETLGDWERFSKGVETFVALRVTPATRPGKEVLDALIRDAGAGLADFRTHHEYTTFPLGNKVWTRTSFGYTNDAGDPVSGFIMVRVQNEQEVVAWAEFLQSDLDIETAVFLPMIAELALPPQD